MLKYSNENFLTENPFMDILVHNLKVLTYSCIIKDEYTANENETIESLKAADLFRACVEKRAELGLFPRIPTRFLEQVGMGQYEIIRYKANYDWELIPEKYHKKLVELLMPWYIENIRGLPAGNLEQDEDYHNGQYVETNNYYRMLIGLPNYGEYGVAIQEFEYLIPDYVEYDKSVMYFHELPPEVNREFERLGILDVVRASYPKEKYLEYMSKDIDLYTARIKLDFQILWCTDEMNLTLTEEFKQRYALNRKFMMSTVYSEAFEFGSTYYHSFMISYTLLITLLDMLCEIQVHIIRKNVLDRRCIAYIFSMYGLPYYRIIPIKYQERLCKQVHTLVKYKSCDREFLSLINLFGFDNITCYKYFLVKNRKINAWGEFEFVDNLKWICPENKYIKHIELTEDIVDYNRWFNPDVPEYYIDIMNKVQRGQVFETYDIDEVEKYFSLQLDELDVKIKNIILATKKYRQILNKIEEHKPEYDEVHTEYEILSLAYAEAETKEKIIQEEKFNKEAETRKDWKEAQTLVKELKLQVDSAVQEADVVRDVAEELTAEHMELRVNLRLAIDNNDISAITTLIDELEEKDLLQADFIQKELKEAQLKQQYELAIQDEEAKHNLYTETKKDYRHRLAVAKKNTRKAKTKLKHLEFIHSKLQEKMNEFSMEKTEQEQIIHDNIDIEHYRYNIPFPILFYLQKGNVMFIRLDDKVLQEGTDFEVVYYNTIKWKDPSVLENKSIITYDFYYNEKTTASFPTTQDYCVKTVQDDVIPLADKNTYSFYETALEEFLFSTTFKYLFCCNDEGVQINPCEWELDPHTGTVELFPEEDEELGNVSFIDLQPKSFNILFRKAEVIATEEDRRLGSIPIPEPFPGYCARGNTFLIKRIRETNSGKLQYGFFKTSGYKFKQLDETGARAKFTNIIGESGSGGSTSIKAGDKYIFYFYYADMEHVSKIELKSKHITLRQTSAYQYEYEIPDGFPVKHYIESGYQAYLKILDSWIPAKWFTILSNGSIILTNHSIAPQHLDRPIDVYLFYLEYDRTIYRNISVGKFHIVAEYDFQKEFTIEFPIDNYLERGNDYIIDMDGIYLEKTEDKAISNRYRIKSQTSNSITIEIPNRDIRPMTGQRVNATFYYQTGENEHRLGIYLDTLCSYINNDDEAVQTTTLFKDKDQTFFMKFPFYPYLETGHSFILTIGSKRINPDRLELVPGTLSTFRFKDLSDAEFKEIKGKRMYLTCFYNTWYLDHTIQGLTVETKNQDVVNGMIELDTPAENFIENQWPMFVMNNNTYVKEDMYDIIYHNLYTNDYTSLSLIYIYIKAKGYIEYKEMEKYDDTTSMHFSHSDIRDLYQIEDIKDKANWKDYDVITTMDGWWDGKKYIPGAHEAIKQNIYEKKFNYERTKYYQVTVITSLSDYASQISYFYGMLYDDVLLEENVDILVPSISSIKRFKLSNLFIYLTTLTYLFNGFEDLIIEAPSKWLWIVGFNFKTDLADLKKYLYDNNRHYSDYRIWDWIKPTSQVEDIVKFVNVYQTNMKVKDIILKGLVNANDYKEWRIWKKLYDSLLIYKTNMDYFKLENGQLAPSYTEFLKEKDPILYASILKLKAIKDQETLQDEIIHITDDVIFILSEYINGPYTSELFKEFAGNDPMKAAKYINILIDFFKSYKIMLLDRAEEINVNDPNDPDNYFRPIDNIDSILEQTIQKDYIIPDERVTTTEHMQFHEWISVPNKTKQLIDFQYPTFNASHPRDEIAVEPAKFQPYHTDLPEITHIKNAGLWMREDVIIQPYLKEMIAKFINPCKININKLDYEITLNGFLYHPKVYAPGAGPSLDIDDELNTGQSIIDKRFKIPEILSKIELKKIFYETFLPGSTTIEKEWFSTEIKGYFKLMATLDYVNTLEDMYRDDLPRLTNIDDIIEELNRGIWDQSTRVPYDFLVGFFSPAKALISIHSLQFSYEDDLAYDVLYYDTFERMCSEMTSLESFNCNIFKYFKDTNEDKNFKKLFCDCKKLQEVAGIDLTDYPNGISTDIYKIKDKTAGIVIFEDAFYDCENLQIGCFRISTYRPLNMQRTFYNCKHLTYVEGTNTIFIDLEAVTNSNLKEAFYGTIRMKCIPEIFISNRISVKISDNPLQYIQYVGNIDLTRTFAYSGIEQCRREKLPMTRFEELRPLHLDDLKDMSKYSFLYIMHHSIDMTQTFYHCNYLQETVWITIGSGDNKVLNMTQTFAECDHLQRVRGLFFKGKLTINMISTFKDCQHLLKLHPITLDKDCILNMNSTFENCTSLADIDEFFTEITDTDSNERGLYGIRGKINLNSTFKDCLGLKEVTLDATKLNTVSNIFSGCTNLRKVTFLNPSPVQMVSFTHYSLDNSTLTYQIEFKNI